MIDSNVLLGVLVDGSAWSTEALERAADEGPLVINPIIFAEVSVRFSRFEDLEDSLPPDMITRTPLPWSAAFLAGKCFVEYRKRGGAQRSPPPDFYLGAHAAVKKFRLLTRDAKRYRCYFPTVELMTPD
jgi:hypothetical protein